MRERQRQHTHPFDAARPGSRLQAVISLRAEVAPTAGPTDPPFRWHDVLHHAPPGDEERGPPEWCVPGFELLFVGERIENPLLVRQLEDGAVEVEDRLCVTTRALAPMIETERAVVGTRLEEARTNAMGRAFDAPTPAAALPHHAHARVVGALRSFTRGVATVPDRVSNAARRAYAFLSTPEGRARFRKGVVDPHDLTAEQKAVTLFVGVCAVLATLVLAHFVVTLSVPELATEWRVLFFLFLYGFCTSLGFPLPIEPALLPAAVAIGAPPAIGTTLLAKLTAAWMVFFLGDEVNDKLRAQAEKRPWVRRGLDAAETFARRFGLFAVALFLAVPGLPDAIALYLFGSLRMPLWKFLLGVGIGGAILYTSVTYGLLHVLGL